MVSQCDMISNVGVWNSTVNPNYKLRSHSLTVLKNGQMREEVKKSFQFRTTILDKKYDSIKFVANELFVFYLGPE